jgi:hypothetical protein
VAEDDQHTVSQLPPAQGKEVEGALSGGQAQDPLHPVVVEGAGGYVTA